MSQSLRSECQRPTAEQFATWSRGVFLDRLVPILERLFDAAERGDRCFLQAHDEIEDRVNHQWVGALALTPGAWLPGTYRDAIRDHDERVRRQAPRLRGPQGPEREAVAGRDLIPIEDQIKALGSAIESMLEDEINSNGPLDAAWLATWTMDLVKPVLAAVRRP